MESVRNDCIGVRTKIVICVSDLLRNIRTQVLIKLIKPYTRIHIPFISQVCMVLCFLYVTDIQSAVSIRMKKLYPIFFRLSLNFSA